MASRRHRSPFPPYPAREGRRVDERGHAHAGRGRRRAAGSRGGHVCRGPGGPGGPVVASLWPAVRPPASAARAPGGALRLAGRHGPAAAVQRAPRGGEADRGRGGHGLSRESSSRSRCSTTRPTRRQAIAAETVARQRHLGHGHPTGAARHAKRVQGRCAGGGPGVGARRTARGVRRRLRAARGLPPAAGAALQRSRGRHGPGPLGAPEPRRVH